jgi:hypothetical protein
MRQPKEKTYNAKQIVYPGVWGAFRYILEFIFGSGF